jgi:hypothetical protein
LSIAICTAIARPPRSVVSSDLRTGRTERTNLAFVEKVLQVDGAALSLHTSS